MEESSLKPGEPSDLGASLAPGEVGREGGRLGKHLGLQCGAEAVWCSIREASRVTCEDLCTQQACLSPCSPCRWPGQNVHACWPQCPASSWGQRADARGDPWGSGGPAVNTSSGSSQGCCAPPPGGSSRGAPGSPHVRSPQLGRGCCPLSVSPPPPSRRVSQLHLCSGQVSEAGRLEITAV